MFRNGVVWHAWERADARLSGATRKERYWVREYRDAYRKLFGPLGNPTVLSRCSRAVAGVVSLVREGGSALEIGPSADAAAGVIVSAIKTDPDGAPDLTDLMEELADALTEGRDTQFCVPHVLIALALLWSKDGEPEAGTELLDSTIDELNEALNAGVNPVLVSRNLSLAYCAKSDICDASGDEEECLVAARRAWEHVPFAEATYRHFVVEHYASVLRRQKRSEEVIQAAVLLAQQLHREAAGQPIDWILEWI